MKKFTKGLLFGSVLAGVTTLLTTKRNGKDNQKALVASLHQTTHDLKQLTSQTSAFKQLAKQTKKTLLPQASQVIAEISHEFTQFQLENQPRIKRIQWYLQKLKEDIQQFSK